MNRKQFLRGCLGGCMLAGAMGPGGSSAAAPAPAEDWRQRFVRRRFAKFLEILSGRMDSAALNATLRDLGRYCSTTDPKVETFRGNFDGYRAHLARTASGDAVTLDRSRGVLTVISPERKDCFCPLVSVEDKTPGVACNCSLGWHEGTWQTVFGQKVEVELKESVLRGGKRCAFEVRISDARI